MRLSRMRDLRDKRNDLIHLLSLYHVPLSGDCGQMCLLHIVTFGMEVEMGLIL